MTEKKKIFLAPEMKVVVLDQADIICTSTPTNGLRIKENEGFDEEGW